MKILRKILWWLVYALPAVLFFSYHPVISLGSNDSMNFELSVPLIWLVIFDLGAFIMMLMLSQQRKRELQAKEQQSAWGINLPGITDRRFFLVALFPLYLTLSILWSDNRLRGILTAGVMWLVFFAVFAILYIMPLTGKPKRLRMHVLIVFFAASVIVCKYCFAQSIMDVLGVSREETMMCLGCTYHAFGFPHPSGFAIEPQFMGNLLLAPTLTALYLLVFRSRKFAKNMIAEADYLENKVENNLLHNKIKLPQVNWAKWQTIGMIALAGFLSTTLFFTFSRGAIYAYAVALIIMIIVACRQKRFRWSLVAIPAVSFLLALGVQGTFAAVGPTAETFVSGITKSIHQLSLGIIDLRDKSVEKPSIDCGKDVEKGQDIVQNSDDNCAKPVDNDVDNEERTVENDVKMVEKGTDDCGELVQNSLENVDKGVDNCAKTVGTPSDSVENIVGMVDKTVEDHVEKAAEETVFDGYVAESTNIRLKLNKVALWTWLSAPNRTGIFTIGLDCHKGIPECLKSAKLTPASVLFGVGLGGAGTAMHAAFPDQVTSNKEIVQHQGMSLLLETGIIGIGLMIFGLVVIFCPQFFSKRFLDGKNAGVGKGENTFWQHPVAPLLFTLIIAYLVTLNFFSGLPNALQIYLMPPLLYLIFQIDKPVEKNNRGTLEDRLSNSKNHGFVE